MAATTAANAQHAENRQPLTKINGDWVYGCVGKKDYKWQCTAVALAPENNPDGEYISMTVNRILDTSGSFTFDSGNGYAGKVVASVDSQEIVSWTQYKWAPPKGKLAIVGKPLSQLLPAVLKGRKLTIRDTKGSLFGHVSLNGSFATLSDMDRQQNVEGQKIAFVRKGNKKPPIRSIDTYPGEYPLEYQMTSVAEVTLQFGDLGSCADGTRPDESNKAILLSSPPEQSDKRAMIIIYCGMDGVNEVWQPLFVKRTIWKSQWEIKPANYGDYESREPKQMSQLFNVEFGDDKFGRKELISTRYFGPNKDCGEQFTFNFNHSGLREALLPIIAQIKEMPLCRGSSDWIRVR